MTYTIQKDFAFSASHQLVGLPTGHPCGRLHGHNYVVRTQLSCPLLDEVGFVLDYGALTPFGKWLDDHLDHRHLNEALPALRNPTAELLAYSLQKIITQVCTIPDTVTVAVAVSETPKTWAWFTP